MTEDLREYVQARMAERGMVAHHQHGKCPDCGDAYAPRVNRDGFVAACPCGFEVVREATHEWLSEHGEELHEQMWGKGQPVPGRYLKCRFSNFERREGVEVAIRRCTAWATGQASESGHGLLLVGPFGSGKTHLAVAAAFTATIFSRVLPHFTSAATLAHDVKKGKDLDMSPVNDACRAQLLILDDIGQTGRTEFDRELIYRIISERYEARKPLIATSNLTEAKLADQLGGALVSRLYEMTEMVALTASDYRKENRGK